jgi:hypothetical protein
VFNAKEREHGIKSKNEGQNRISARQKKDKNLTKLPVMADRRRISWRKKVAGFCQVPGPNYLEGRDETCSATRDRHICGENLPPLCTLR